MCLLYDIVFYMYYNWICMAELFSGTATRNLKFKCSFFYKQSICLKLLFAVERVLLHVEIQI